MIVDMDYDTDTLTTACKNRAASKKLFQQLQQQNFARNYYPQSTTDQPGMLHRTPSGAQKKIRQRQEQKWLKATSSSSLDQQTMNSECGYRGFVDSNAYKSILPDDIPFLMPPVPPRAAPRLSAPLSSSLTSLNSTVGSCCIPTTSTIGGKPTVEVHPMPSKQMDPSGGDSRSSPDLVTEKVREKPAVPKKPSKLILAARIDNSMIGSAHLSSSMTSLNLTPTSSQQSSFFPLQSGNTVSSLAYKSNLQSPLSTSRIFSTPSLMCLHTALMQPSLSREDLELLEAKRRKLIESISHKVDVLDNARIDLEEEYAANDALKILICDDLTNIGNHSLVEKIEKNLIQNSQLIRFETKLRLQIERYETMCISNDSAENDMRAARLIRLRNQIEDLSVVRKGVDRRASEIDKQVQSLLNDQRLGQWRYFKDIWRKLTAERQEIDERLSLGREQLIALQKSQPAI